MPSSTLKLNRVGDRRGRLWVLIGCDKPAFRALLFVLSLMSCVDEVGR